MIRAIWVRRLALLALVGFVTGLFIGGAQPAAVGLVPAPWDKLIHAIAFGGLAVLLELALRPRVWVLVMLPIAVSAADEFHQFFLPGRSASLHDWLAGVVGVCLACLLLRRTILHEWVKKLRD